MPSKAANAIKKAVKEPDTKDISEQINRIAKELIASGKFKTFRDNEQVYHYAVGIYNKNGEVMIKETIHAMQEGGESTNFCNEVIGKVKRGTYIDQVSFLEHAEHKIVIKNGILNLDTLELSEHTPDWLSLTKFPVNFDSNATCPGILKFISEIVRPEDISLLQEWAGYNLWVFGYPAQKAMLFVGDGGNGKSTFIGILEAMIGRQNRSAVSLHELEDNRFAKADLFGKASNLYPDLPNRDLKSTGIFKMLTGGDPIRAEEKNIKAWTFHNFAKLTFSCNEVPRVPEDSVAFFRRWIIVEFPYSFEGTKQEDKDLKERLTNNEPEMSGFLNWALEGLSRLRDNGWHFSNGKTVDMVKADYIVRSDAYKAFAMHCVVEDPNGEVAKDVLYDAYREHCEMHKVTSRSRDSFFKNFKDQYKPGTLQTYRPDSKSENGTRPYVFKGILLRDREKWCVTIEDIDEKPTNPDGHGGRQGGQSGQVGRKSVQGVESVEGDGYHVAPEIQKKFDRSNAHTVDSDVQNEKQTQNDKANEHAANEGHGAIQDENNTSNQEPEKQGTPPKEKAIIEAERHGVQNENPIVPITAEEVQAIIRGLITDGCDLLTNEPTLDMDGKNYKIGITKPADAARLETLQDRMKTLGFEQVNPGSFGVLFFTIPVKGEGPQ